MKSLELFLPYVTTWLYAVSEPLALQALRSACVEFCRRTDIVQRVGAAQNIVSGTQDYAVTIPTSMVLSRVLGVSWQGRWLAPIPPGDVRSDVALRGADIGNAVALDGDPQVFFQKTPESSTVSLYPIPDTALTGGLLIKASFFPTFDATTVEDQLFDEWAEGIAAGAIARLQAVQGQPFTGNPALAAMQFARAISDAKRQTITGKQVNASRVQPRRFA